MKLSFPFITWFLLAQPQALAFVTTPTTRDERTATRDWSLPRRDFLAGAAVLTAGTSTAKEIQPIADLPIIRIRLPKGGFGREYVAIPLKIQGQGPFDFMIDTGLTTEFITPHLQHVLAIRDEGASKIQALAAGGTSG
jgi:hypothetical protein